METNTKMTHYHKEIKNHEEVWTKYIYDAVMWQQKNVVSPETGFVSAKEVNVFIPILTYDIKEEDVIVKGIVEDEEPSKITEKFTVTSAIPCDFGSKAMQHTELVGR